MSITTKEYDVTVESGILGIFQSQTYKLERVFAEFIDNSLQSYLDHMKQLSKMPDGSKCEVKIIWNADHITIVDNSFGMNDEEFGRALKLKAINPDALRNDRLSVYGMGLKYASVYLGNNYKINTTRYGEDIRRIAEINVPYFTKNNPTSVSASVVDELKEERGTEIKITNLRIKRTDTKEREIREKLGIIYNHYIQEGILTITINKIPVKYSKPDLRKKDDGSKYFEKFDGSFESDGITYTYNGWIGILTVGNQAITGLNLTQAKRCIQLGWKPEAIFGKGNSFQNSRVVGEIVFSGDHSILSYDKDQFVWSDNGTEDIFIRKLLDTPGFKYIIKECKKLKKTSDAEKIKSKSTSNVNINGVTEVPVDNINTPLDKSSSNNSASTETSINNNPINNTSEDSKQEEQEQYKCYKITVHGKQIPLYVNLFEGDANQEWIKLDNYKDGYCLHVNFKNEYILTNFTSQSSIIGSNSLALVLATSILQAQDAGVKLSNSLTLLNSLNKAMSSGDNNE